VATVARLVAPLDPVMPAVKYVIPW
jgi:hypothetical protein